MPSLSLSVARDRGGFDGDFESFMRLMGAYFSSNDMSAGVSFPSLCPFLPLGATVVRRGQATCQSGHMDLHDSYLHYLTKAVSELSRQMPFDGVLICAGDR